METDETKPKLDIEEICKDQRADEPILEPLPKVIYDIEEDDLDFCGSTTYNPLMVMRGGWQDYK